MSPKKAVIIIVSLFVLLSTAIGDDAVYKSEHCTITNPRITSGGGESGKSEHYTVTDIQIGNIAGGKAESEHYTIEAFPIRRRLPQPNPPTVNPVNTLTNNSTQTLSGTKDKNTSICINGYEVIPINTDTTWNIASYDIGKEDGLKTLSVTSKNKYNLESPSVTVNITLDTIAPAIAITSPQNNAELASSPITVSGTINEECAVTVNGVIAAIDGANFAAEGVILTYDTNTVTATATDLAGNTSEAKITVSYLDKVPPVIRITSPSNGAVIDKAPITVTGTIDDSTAYVDVNGVFADVANGIFTAEGVDLRYGANSIKAAAADEAGNTAAHEIMVNSTVTSDYELIKLTEDSYPGAPENPVAGSQIELKARLIVEGNPAPNEPIKFSIRSGGGSLSQSSVNTDVNGEAVVMLTTGANVMASDEVEAIAQNFPLKKVVFCVAVKPAQAALLIKLTDESKMPVPGAAMPLIVKLTDISNNSIENEAINFAITEGGGSITPVLAVTNYYGIAEVKFTAPNTPETTTQITASSAVNPSANAIFSITTSPNSAVLIDSLFDKVDLNAQKIHDQIAEMTVTSDDLDKAAAMQYKVWQKGDLMKIQDILTGEITIRPQLTMTEGAPADAQIINYDSGANIYAIKTKASGQIEEMPYTLTYIDYNKGVIAKIESYYRRADAAIIKASLEMTEFVQISTANNAWVYNKKIQKMYENNSIVSTTTTTITTRQTNASLTDSEFQQ